MRRAVRSISLAAGVLCLALPARAATPPIRAEFEAVCEALRQGDNPYYGLAPARRLTEHLRDPATTPQQRAGAHLQLAVFLWRQGRFEEALEEVGKAEELARRLGIDRRPEVRLTLLFRRAMSHLLLAENLNCIGMHTSASCILPLAPEGVHRDLAHTRAAGDRFLDYLAIRPDDVQVRWLLNLARMLSGDYPARVPEPLRLPPGALASEEAMPRWREVAPELGVNARDLAGGAVMDDFDGDGLLDLVSSTSDPCGPVKAFRNDGRGGFEDVAAAWGLDEQLGGLNLVHADFDGDGRLDLLILRGGWMGREGRIRNSLLRNELDLPAGRFVDVTRAAGLAEPAYPTQAAAWADFDGDGDLDLFVGNEGTGLTADPDAGRLEVGDAYPSQLFRNRGDGTFEEIAAPAGVSGDGFTKGVAWGDYDNDGDPDLYLSNVGPNRLYRNRGDGTFEDATAAAGVAGPATTTFATWFFDYDNDGDLDLWVSGYGVPEEEVSAALLGFPIARGQPLLYRNDGGRFTDMAGAAGLDRPHLVMGANFGDLDGDGRLDVYLGTGTPAFEALMPNAMYRNTGERFVDVTFAGGFGHLQKGHGVAFGDLDNDGDEDLFHQLGGFFPYDAYANALFENPGGGRRWITLRLEGRAANRFGVGARIEVRVRDAAGATRSIHRLAGSGGSFGGSSLQQEIGLGDAERIERVAVTWPGSGLRQSFDGVEPDRFYRLVEGAERLEPIDLAPIRWAPPLPRPAHDAAPAEPAGG